MKLLLDTNVLLRAAGNSSRLSPTAQAILDAEKKYNRKITVAFNYRYAPKHQKIKELLQSGEIGKITSVDFSWYLDTSHGADYFRRM